MVQSVIDRVTIGVLISSLPTLGFAQPTRDFQLGDVSCVLLGVNALTCKPPADATYDRGDHCHIVKGAEPALLPFIGPFAAAGSVQDSSVGAFYAVLGGVQLLGGLLFVFGLDTHQVQVLDEPKTSAFRPKVNAVSPAVLPSQGGALSLMGEF